MIHPVPFGNKAGEGLAAAFLQRIYAQGLCFVAHVHADGRVTAHKQRPNEPFIAKLP